MTKIIAIFSVQDSSFFDYIDRADDAAALSC